MRNTTLYSGRFRVIELASYFILLTPWIADFIGSRALPYSTFTLVIKVTLSAAIVAFVFLLRDVRKKIDSLDTLKQDLALSAIHDLKGPLTSIIGVLSLITDQEVEKGMRDRLLHMAVQSSKSMEKLIHVMVDTGRMEVAKLILQKTMVEVGACVDQSLAGFSGVSADTGIKLSIVTAADLPRAHADKDLLERILENLVLNAFKYSRRGGEVLVTTTFADGNLQFEVRDNGAGIPEEHIRNIFNKYYQVSGKEATSRRGSGLGLYFCRLAVEAHGGNIKISSKAGQGTTVFFTIPGQV